MAVIDPSLNDPQVPPAIGKRPRNLHLWLIAFFSLLAGGAMFYGLSTENDAAKVKAKGNQSVDKDAVAAKTSDTALEPVFAQQNEAGDAIKRAEEKAKADAALAKLSAAERAAITGGANPYQQNPTSTNPPLPPVPGGRPANELPPEVQERNRREASAATSGILAFKGSGAIEKTANELNNVVAPLVNQRNEALAQNAATRDGMLRQLAQAQSGAAQPANPASGAGNSNYMAGSAYANNNSGMLVGRAGEITSGARSDTQWTDQTQNQSRNALPEKAVAIPATSNYMLIQGSIIPAALISAINSDMPGTISAVVTQDIYDSIDSKYKLIPKGSKLFGLYNNQVKVGQSRVLMAFTRLIFPSGASVMLGGMGGADEMGRAGVDGDVDNHFFKMFGASLLIAVVDRIANPPPKNQTNNYYGGGGTQTNTAGQVLSETSKTILDRNRSIPPTIEINAGERINIVVNKDLELPPNVTRVNQQR